MLIVVPLLSTAFCWIIYLIGRMVLRIDCLLEWWVLWMP